MSSLEVNEIEIINASDKKKQFLSEQLNKTINMFG